MILFNQVVVKILQSQQWTCHTVFFLFYKTNCHPSAFLRALLWNITEGEMTGSITSGHRYLLKGLLFFFVYIILSRYLYCSIWCTPAAINKPILFMQRRIFTLLSLVQSRSSLFLNVPYPNRYVRSRLWCHVYRVLHQLCPPRMSPLFQVISENSNCMVAIVSLLVEA